jgi:2-oxoglutarate dehydrogenase E2 component (dihydrolipoamide succinyltransferase)
MPIELKIPTVGESITEVQIGEWLKSEGDTVKQDEPVAVIDSEKTTFELPAPQSGRLTKILHQAGETVAVGAVVAQLESQGNGTERHPHKKTPVEAGRPAAEDDKESTDEKAGQAPSETLPPADESESHNPAKSKPETPAPEDLKPERPSLPAKEAKRPDAKPLSQIAKPQLSAGREEEVVPMTMLRRTAAQRLVEAQQTMAMLTTFNEADMSAIQAVRSEYQEPFEKRYQVKLGLMSFFIKAAVDALKQFPKLNAEIRDHDIVYHNYVDIGVAVATERGLVVPVLRNAEQLTFAGLEKAISDFARRAKEGKLKPDELAGGTFTITNGGVFGSLLSTPIINPPQSGILGLHTIQERPVAVQGQVVIRPMMYLALTYDHRLVDGREAVLFLRRVKQVIEVPARMLIEI